MKFLFTQHETESRLNKCLDYGDETEIAKRIGKGSSLVSQMFNPDDERESNFYKALKEIAAEIDFNPDNGCKMLRLFNELASRHLPDDKKRCPKAATSKLLGEWTQFIDAAINDKPVETQIDELSDVIAQAVELRKAKETELKREIRADVFETGKEKKSGLRAA